MQNAQANRQTEKFTSAISAVEQLNTKIENVSAMPAKSIDSKLDPEWTNSYEAWSKWEDLEELNDNMELEKQKLDEIAVGSSASMGHYHDHSEGNRCMPIDEQLLI